MSCISLVCRTVSHKIFINEDCTTTKSSLQLENPESKINTNKGYFFAPPVAPCLSSAFFCFSLIIAASLNTTREKNTVVTERKII